MFLLFFLVDMGGKFVPCQRSNVIILVDWRIEVGPSCTENIVNGLVALVQVL